MKKVIFLDMDGVLNCKNTPNVNGKVWLIDRQLVKRFNRIFDTCKDVEVVLSSSWRYAVENKTIDINWLMENVGYTGPKIVHMTPPGEDDRGYEIQAWLDVHKDVEKFVIIDDDTDMAHLIDHLIKTDFWSEEGGITDSDVDRIIKIFS